MIVNQQNLQLLNVAYSAAFKAGLSEAPSIHMQFSTNVNSVTSENYYPWLGQSPGMTEWLGERAVKSLEQFDYSIRNKEYESTIGVKRTTIEDDQYGVYTPMFQNFGDAVGTHPDELTFGLLGNALTEQCYDGQPFFSASHPTGNTTASNLDSGGGGNYWYLMCLSKPIKPFVWQSRRRVALQARVDLRSENVFWKNEFVWGADGRYNVGFGLWQTMYASNQTLNQTNFNAAYQTMLAYRNDQGRPMGTRPTHIMVGPSNRAAALEVLQTERLSNGATNYNRNAVDIMLTPWLT